MISLQGIGITEEELKEAKRMQELKEKRRNKQQGQDEHPICPSNEWVNNILKKTAKKLGFEYDPKSE